MIALVLFAHLAAFAAEPSPAACERTLLPESTVDLALELARAHVQVHKAAVPAAELGPVRLVVHAHPFEDVVLVDAEVPYPPNRVAYVQFTLDAAMKLTAAKMLEAPSAGAARAFATGRDQEVRYVNVDKTARPLQLSPAEALNVASTAQTFVLGMTPNLSSPPHVNVLQIERAEPTDTRVQLQAVYTNPGAPAATVLNLWVASQGRGRMLVSVRPLPEELARLETIYERITEFLDAHGLRSPLPARGALVEVVEDGYHAHVMLNGGLRGYRATLHLKPDADGGFAVSRHESAK